MRVVIADDETLLRDGLAMLLDQAGFTVAGKAANPVELHRLVATERPDVAVVDIKMPPTFTDEGIVAAQEILDAYPGTSVLVLSHYLESGYAMRLLEGHPGGAGYLLKERVSSVAVLADALHRLAEGRSNLGISQELSLSPKTVEAHVGSILLKLGIDGSPDAHRRVLAVLAFLRSAS